VWSQRKISELQETCEEMKDEIGNQDMAIARLEVHLKRSGDPES
jgi:hypothetical protein